MRTKRTFQENYLNTVFRMKEYEFDDDNDDEFLPGGSSDYEFEEDDDATGGYVEEEYEFDEDN